MNSPTSHPRSHISYLYMHTYAVNCAKWMVFFFFFPFGRIPFNIKTRSDRQSNSIGLSCDVHTYISQISRDITLNIFLIDCPNVLCKRCSDSLRLFMKERDLSSLYSTYVAQTSIACSIEEIDDFGRGGFSFSLSLSFSFSFSFSFLKEGFSTRHHGLD